MTKEIDLRKELSNMLFGNKQEIEKAHHVLVRYIRKDAQSRPYACSCNVAGEGSENPNCIYCLGEGYYWDEIWKPTIKFEVGSESAKARRILLENSGSIKGQLTRFYFQHDVNITVQDRIIELKRDSEGNIQKPYVRDITWQIQDIDYKRSDKGRVEYVTAYCSKLNVLYNDFSR